jgi:hypothetical protein
MITLTLVAALSGKGLAGLTAATVTAFTVVWISVRLERPVK